MGSSKEGWSRRDRGGDEEKRSGSGASLACFSGDTWTPAGMTSGSWVTAAVTRVPSLFFWMLGFKDWMLNFFF